MWHHLADAAAVRGLPTVPDFSARRVMMVDTQVRPSDVTKFPIIDAMLDVPRELYVPPALREAAYVGENLEFAPGRVLLEPRTFGKLLDGLNVGPDDMVLDIGCGLGYSTAVLAHMADFVVGIENDANRAEEAQANLSENGVDNAAVFEAPLADGAPKNGPYDVIIAEGAVEDLPQSIVDQLAEGGRIACVFADGTLGVARIGVKSEGRISWRSTFNASAPVLPGFEKSKAFAL